jgi:hypothetical protein
VEAACFVAKHDEPRRPDPRLRRVEQANAPALRRRPALLGRLFLKPRVERGRRHALARILEQLVDAIQKLLHALSALRADQDERDLFDEPKTLAHLLLPFLGS